MNQKLKHGNHNLSKTKEQKEQMILDATIHFGNFLHALGFDWENDNHMAGTPKRVSKAFINDLVCGCYDDAPHVTAFDNHEKYSGIVYSGVVPIVSLCSHHFLPFIGEAHIAYLPDPNGKVVGYSKLGRIGDWFARRPQVQENLTSQIHDYVNKVCEKNLGVAVMISAKHMCACARGVKQNTVMMTSKLSGSFLDNKDLARFEFYKFVELSKK